MGQVNLNLTASLRQVAVRKSGSRSSLCEKRVAVTQPNEDRTYSATCGVEGKAGARLLAEERDARLSSLPGGRQLGLQGIGAST